MSETVKTPLWMLIFFSGIVISALAIQQSVLINSENLDNIPTALTLSSFALALVLLSMKVRNGKRNWLFAPILVPLAYFTIGNMLFVLK